MANRLAQSTSPYLKQHAENPIDWFEWGAEAFAKAREENKPIFLSVGYSSCHWCHVMAHESFEDTEVAALLNQEFVSIKLDREERPDIDEALMVAVQLLTGRGGWPITAFLTPDRKPFFAGTYFPRHDRGQYPGFLSLARQIATMWRTKRPEVVKSANEVVNAIRQTLGRTLGSLTSTIEDKLFEEAVRALKADFDPRNGGFGSAPKFPSHTALSYLLDYALLNREHAEDALLMTLSSLEAMALGGIHDQVGGGFHRYSTDAEWHLPHFEKMLYDNALLLRLYSQAEQLANAMEIPSAELFADTAMGIVRWVRDHMTSPDGHFYSAMDADCEGGEGLTYTWTADEIRAALDERAPSFMLAFGITEEGNFLDEASKQRTGQNILRLKEDRRREFASELDRLASLRSAKPQPMQDDKAIAAWNGMMICGLLEAGETALAERCAIAWSAAIEQLGQLPHQITGGVASGIAVLDDYAWMTEAFLLLSDPEIGTGNPAYLEIAQRLADMFVARFEDRERGGFFFTSEEHENLYGKSKPCLDQSVPSANAIAIRALIGLGRVDEAERALMAVLGWAQKMPNAAESLVHAALALKLTRAAAEGGAAAIAPVPAAPPVSREPVTARLSSRELIADGSGWAAAALEIRIPDGLHLNTANPPARWLVPTELVFEGTQGVVEYPEGANDRYEGTLAIPFRAQLQGAATEFEVRLRFQACTESECRTPDEIILDGVILRG